MELLAYLIQWAAIALAWLWLLATLGAFLTMILSIGWLVLAQPASRTSAKSLTTKWMKSDDDLGERLTSQRLARPRKVLAVSASVFVSLVLFGAGFALLKQVAG